MSQVLAVYELLTEIIFVINFLVIIFEWLISSCRNFIFLSCNRLTFSAIKQDMQRDILWGKDIIQHIYNQNQKRFILEFLYLEEYLALRTEQLPDQIK